MKATVTRDNYAYYGRDEAEAVTWLEDPQQGLAKGKVIFLSAGTEVDLLGDAVTSDKFALLAGVGNIQNQYGQDIQAFWPATVPASSGKYWIPSASLPEEQPTDVEEESGNGDSNADGTSTAQQNQPGSQAPGGTDKDGAPLGGNAGSNTTGLLDGLSKGDKLSLLLGIIGIGVAIYYAKHRGG